MIGGFTTASVDNKKLTKSHGQLLDEIGRAFVNMIPEDGTKIYFVREKAFNARAAQSEMGIYKVVGLTDWLLYKLKEDWHELYPVSVKKLVTGSGKADKAQVASSLAYYFGEHEYPNDDESDAAAVAAAFLIQHNIFKQQDEAKGGGSDVSASPEVHQGV